MNNAMNLEKPMSYVGVFNRFNRIEKTRLLTPEEGGQGHKVEFNLYLKFPVLQKRLTKPLGDNENLRPFFGYSRLWIDYGFATRVAKEVESSPILPPTNRYGFRYDKLVHANGFSGDIKKKGLSESLEL